MWIHGGGWSRGRKEQHPPINLMAHGYAIVSIEYRLSEEAPFPAQIEDCKAAVRWLRANAARFRIDGERIAVFGASAGGHLAALLGTTGGIADFEGFALGNAGYFSRAKAVVDFYGPADLRHLDSQQAPCAPPRAPTRWLTTWR